MHTAISHDQPCSGGGAHTVNTPRRAVLPACIVSIASRQVYGLLPSFYGATTYRFSTLYGTAGLID